MPEKSSQLGTPSLVIPAPGFALSCRNNHYNNWDVRVIASESGSAAVVSVRCAICGHTLSLDKNRNLDATGKIEFKPEGEGNTLKDQVDG